jgi:hypothetical protein
MRPFRPYDPQGPGQKGSRTIVHQRSLSGRPLVQGLSPLVPLGLTPNDPIGEVGSAERHGSLKEILLVEKSRSDGLILWDEPSKNHRNRTVLEANATRCH